MAGTILENLSGRKLAILTSLLLLCQLACFLLGGLIAPAPSSAQPVTATKCVDAEGNKTRWMYSRGSGHCDRIHDFEEIIDRKLTADNIVFTFQLPLPRDRLILDYSRWQQNLIGVLQLDIKYSDGENPIKKTLITLDARMGYRNIGDPDSEWKQYASSVEERNLECEIHDKKDGYYYDCLVLPLFELGSLHHDFYLLNLRFPSLDRVNVDLGKLADVHLVTIYQNGGFTKVWLSMKTVFFPCIVAIMGWFWHRIRALSRPPALLEYMLMALGSALTLLNLPLEYLTLAYDIPFTLLLSDMRQGIFYATLLSFWLVFAGEHLMIKDTLERNHLKAYWRHLSVVLVGCLSLFVFDLCERGVQLRNPFYSIWATKIGTNLALTFIIVAGVSSGLYFFFLSYMIWEVFRNISAKRAALPTMASARRVHYEGIIYRFKFLMLATLLCAAMTVIGFILGQVSEGRWKWDDDIQLDYTSAFFTGVYGMWNIYIFALIVLYAPSHKRWPIESDPHSSTNEEIEFSRLPTEPCEISALTAFAKKVAAD